MASDHGLYGDWDKGLRLMRLIGTKMPAVTKTVLGRIGLFYRDQVKLGIVSQAPGGQQFEPLKEATIIAKSRKGRRKDKALIDNGDLKGSINFDVDMGTLSVRVGVHKMKRYASGEQVANIAAVHEFGNKKGTIPPRPFLRPIEESLQIRQEAKTRITLWMQQAIDRLAKGL
mgnify:CR=1 FL=1